jgi:hypothetical protein
MEDGSGGSIVIMVVFWLGLYLFYAWVMSRLGRKFGVGSFVEFLIPIWNIVLLLRCAGMGAIHLIWFFIPLVNLVVAAVVWAKIAGRLDYSPILFGLLFILFPFLPPLILAFDRSQPVR